MLLLELKLIVACNMLDDISLKTRFRDHFGKMKKPKNVDRFLYLHFKNNGHSPSKTLIQPVYKTIYDPKS